MFKSRVDELNFKFTNDSLDNISKNDLLIYMGGGFEPWINGFVDKLDKSNVTPINVSRGVKFISYDKPVKINDTEFKDNPYYLMNIDNYKIALMNIKNSRKVQVSDTHLSIQDFPNLRIRASIKVFHQKKLKAGCLWESPQISAPGIMIRM
jgi:hypothetical protein